MKLWSKDALVLGGIYSVLSTPFVYGNNEMLEQISSILFFIFAICAIMLCFNKTPKFITYTMNIYPRISYYLASIGWIPYFIIFFVVCFLGIAYFVEYDRNNAGAWLVWVGYILDLSIPVSLIIAFIRQKK